MMSLSGRKFDLTSVHLCKTFSGRVPSKVKHHARRTLSSAIVKPRPRTTSTLVSSTSWSALRLSNRQSSSSCRLSNWRVQSRYKEGRKEEVMAQFSVNAQRFDPYKNFKFRVKWDGRYVAGISKVSMLKRTTEVVKHREGGDPSSSRKSPGRTEYEAVTLEREIGRASCRERVENS